VRFSGINVGTVDNITIINDSTVKVEMVIQKHLNQFIKVNSKVSIGSEGIIGDKYIIISQGGTSNALAKNEQILTSIEPIETDAILASLVITAKNAQIITKELSEIMYKINSGNGTLGRLIEDSTIAENINATIVNLKKSSKGLNENMEAAKHNILLRGYYNKNSKRTEQMINK
jgi:phospholipid/cholesterol/gamma-HCH transport system substrate-binding protein